MAADSNETAEGEGTGQDSEPAISLSRRSYVTLSALAGIPALGFFDGEPGGEETVEVQVKELFGYGGTLYATSTTTQTLMTTETDIDEPNDTISEATPIAADVDVNGYLTEGDVDWFAFDLAAGDGITARLDFESDLGVVGLVLYDADGDFVDERYLSASQGYVDYTAGSTGTHFAQVVDVEADAGSYVIRISTGEGTGTETATATPTETTIATVTEIDDEYGEQGYGEYGYGGVK